jgi:hypothetical protein
MSSIFLLKIFNPSFNLQKNLPPPDQNMASAATAVTAVDLEIPSEKTLAYAARIAIERDMAIMLDYYVDTRDGKAFLGEDSTTKDKMLVRSEDEYTSPIQKIFRVEEDFVVITENSIYIVSRNIKKRIISSPTA